MKSLQELESIESLDETKHTKKCTKCGELKSLSEFNKSSKTKDRKHCYCRKCCILAAKRSRSSKTTLEYKIDSMYSDAKRRAKKKGLVFTIEKSDIQIPERCPCLGITLEVLPYEPNVRKGALPTSPSLDRIDSSKGYTPHNTWVVSHRANNIMSNATPMELKLIYKALDAKLSSIEREKQMELDL